MRRLILQDFEAAFKKVDFLIGPTTPGPAFGIGERVANPLEMYLADVCTISSNLVGAPAISIPCGFTRAGLPIGAQIMAGAMEEPRLLRLARAYERETNWRAARRPSL